MKPTFSMSDALGAAFRLPRRKPLTVFVWGALMVGLTVALYALMIPLFANMPVDDGAEAMEAYLVSAQAASAGINGMSLLMYLLMLVLLTAAMRATLRPGSTDRFLYMRLGMDEVRVGVTIVAIFIVWYVAVVVAALIGFGIGLALWSAGPEIAMLVVGLYGVGVFLAALWAYARASLIAPATMILGRFAFAEGWRIARGQAWKLVGMYVLVWLIYMVGYLLVLALCGAVLFGGFTAQGLEWPTDLRTLADLQPLVGPMILPGLVALLPLAFAFGAIMGLYGAPPIVAARQLLDGQPVTPEAAPATVAASPEI